MPREGEFFILPHALSPRQQYPVPAQRNAVISLHLCGLAQQKRLCSLRHDRNSV